MNFGIASICFLWGVACAWVGERHNVSRRTQYVGALVGGIAISLVLSAMWGN